MESLAFLRLSLSPSLSLSLWHSKSLKKTFPPVYSFSCVSKSLNLDRKTKCWKLKEAHFAACCISSGVGEGGQNVLLPVLVLLSRFPNIYLPTPVLSSSVRLPCPEKRRLKTHPSHLYFSFVFGIAPLTRVFKNLKRQHDLWRYHCKRVSIFYRK